MVEYEWDVEVLDNDGEIIDHLHQTSAADCLKVAAREDYADIVLVCDNDSFGRAWAYARMEYGELVLPPTFKDAFGHDVYKVPQRFHKELQKAQR